MSDDLDRRLRTALDRVPASDVWGEATRAGRPDHPMPHGVPRRGRVLIVATVFLVLVGAFVLAEAVRPRDAEVSTPASPGTVSSTLSYHGGSLACTATVDRVLDPGRPIAMSLAVENVGASTQHVSSFAGTRLTVESESGEQLWDSAIANSVALGPGPDMGLDLPPGETHVYSVPPVRVAWGGPLHLTPTCDGLRLPALIVDVAGSGSTPTAQQALDRALDATSGVFGSCTPKLDGTSLVGTLDPPDGGIAPSLDARCIAEIRAYDGFVAVDIGAVSPATIELDDLPAYYFQMPSPHRAETNSESLLWTFVVTATDVITVQGPISEEGIAPGFRTVDFRLGHGGWSRSVSPCGNSGQSGPFISFFEPCSGT